MLNETIKFRQQIADHIFTTFDMPEVLEKHFTYHLRMPGDDHEGALTPEMLRELVQGVGRIEAMLGTEEKEPVAAEAKAMAALRVKMREVGFD